MKQALLKINPNEIRLVGIAGPSGSGKSTLANYFSQKYPHLCTVVHLDDFYKKKDQVPHLGTITNWDHPTALNFKVLIKHLTKLKKGKSVKLFVSSELGIYQPQPATSSGAYIEYITTPKPIIFVEGHFAFYSKKVREMLDLKIFLDIPIEESISRRALNKFIPDEGYLKHILMPMYHQFLVPTKKYAEVIIDVSQRSQLQVFREIRNHIENVF